MPMCEIKDHKTGQTLKAYDFGGPEIYYAGTSLVYAPLGGTSVSTSEHLATLQPLGITSIMKPRWEVTGHTNVGTANWRVSVVDTSTGETKDGVYPFNLQGNVYELECQPGTWVMASCGGYKIESSWEGKQSYQAYRLKGTGEVINTYRFIGTYQVISYISETRQLDILASPQLMPTGFFQLTSININSVYSAPNGDHLNVEESPGDIYNKLALNSIFLGASSLFIVVNVVSNTKANFVYIDYYQL